MVPAETIETIVRRIVNETITARDAQDWKEINRISVHAISDHEAKHHVTSYGVAHFSTTQNELIAARRDAATKAVKEMVLYLGLADRERRILVGEFAHIIDEATKP